MRRIQQVEKDGEGPTRRKNHRERNLGRPTESMSMKGRGLEGSEAVPRRVQGESVCKLSSLSFIQ